MRQVSKRFGLVAVSAVALLAFASAASGAKSLVKLSPSKLNFGSVPVGTQPSLSVTVTNTSKTTTVMIAGLSATGNFAFDPASSCLPAGGSLQLALLPGDSCVATAVFIASPAGTYTGELDINTENVGLGPVKIPLSGKAA
jgi:hypothetical protein